MKKAVYAIAAVLVIGLLVFLVANNIHNNQEEESTIVCSEKDKC